jgi:hypothetical protein
MIMEVNGPIPLSVIVYRKGFSGLPVKMEWLSIPTLEANDGAVDSQFVIRGNSKEAIRRILISSNIPSLLLSAFPFRVYTSENKIFCEQRRIELAPDHLRDMMDLLHKLAAEIERAQN